MTFAARLYRLPIAYDPAAAAPVAQGFADLAPEIRALLAGTAGCSPFLADLILREGDWLRAALAAPPDRVVPELLAALDPPPDQLAMGLRVARRRVALFVALADLGGVWDLAAVTGALSDLADRAVALGLRALVAAAIHRHRLPGQTADDIDDGAGMVVLAMGKLGARELNYSSDIDLICLFDDSRYPGAALDTARPAFVTITRQLAALLSDRTADGHVFRTDLRLRPDAGVTPVCLPLAMAEQYYESAGRTWERAAYIKARPCAGDLAAGARFLTGLRPFVWRRHLDFAAIADAHDMRLRIRDHKGLAGPITLADHDLKLGAGGIREIEFFTQTRQLIAGGRDPGLRDPTTTGGLAALAAAGWVPADVATTLATAYRAHREVEHRLQMIADAQTHRLPGTAAGFDRLARLCGNGDTAAFTAGLQARLHQVAELAEGFFAPGADPAPPPDPELTPAQAELVAGWYRYPALRAPRARPIFRRLRPQLLHRLLTAADPDEALAALDGFLAGLPAGVQLFSLFAANPSLVDLIADIAATAPALARYLAGNAAVFDAVIGGGFFAPWPGMAALRAELAARLAATDDYEQALDQARGWAREWHFRIGVHHLRGLDDAFAASRSYADLAEAVVGALWPVVVAGFARRHGPPPGQGAVVVAMGGLGAGALHAGSDLDLLVIYDAADAGQSDGPRPLASRTYYARLTQALVAALAAPMGQGRLYAVDMRLRPSGRQGPVAVSLPAFVDYQRHEAWTWEHLALTRARVIAGPPALAARVEGFRRQLLHDARLRPAIRAEVATMRDRLATARPGSTWDPRAGPGRLLDIGLFAQAGALLAGVPARQPPAQLRAAAGAGVITRQDAATLLAGYNLLWPLQVAAHLLSADPPDPDRLGAGARRFLLREGGAADTAELAARIAAAGTAAAAIITAALGREPAA